MHLNLLRSRIDRLDTKLLIILRRRFDIVEKLRSLKQKRGLPPEDKEREKEIFEELQKKSKELHLNPGVVKKIFKIIIQESINLQKKK